MSNINTVIFDIGNVILDFDYKKVVKQYTDNEEEQKILFENVIHSPEWLGNSLIDTGYITRKEAISMIQDRTNHKYDNLIHDFFMNYSDYASVNPEAIDIIKD